MGDVHQVMSMAGTLIFRNLFADSVGPELTRTVLTGAGKLLRGSLRWCKRLMVSGRASPKKSNWAKKYVGLMGFLTLAKIQYDINS